MGYVCPLPSEHLRQQRPGLSPGLEGDRDRDLSVRSYGLCSSPNLACSSHSHGGQGNSPWQASPDHSLLLSPNETLTKSLPGASHCPGLCSENLCSVSRQQQA